MTFALEQYSELTHRKFVFIIDEWDSIIRETDDDTQKLYFEFLRSLFKSSRFTPKCISAAYMTGILPMKKRGSQSAISDFREYTVFSPGKFAGYIGFNENDIHYICDKYDLSIDEMKQWYDGYTFGNVHDVYNPYSVMNMVDSGEYESYWRQTSTAESLKSFIELNYDGLQESVTALIIGEEIPVVTRTFNEPLIKSLHDTLSHGFFERRKRWLRL